MAVSGALAGACLLVADLILRPSWDFNWSDHFKGAPILYLGPTALLGLLWSQLSYLNRALTGHWLKSRQLRDWARALVVGIAGALLSIPTAFRTFSGPAISKTSMGAIGPWIFLLVFGGAATCATFQIAAAQRSILRAKWRRPLLGAGGFFCLGTALLWIDISVYPSLYRYLHHFLEYCAFASFFAHFQLLGFLLIHQMPAARVGARIVGGLFIAMGATYVAVAPLRVWVDTQLSHAWVDEFYVGRSLRRATQVELLLRGSESLPMERVRVLRRRFGIRAADLRPAYLKAVSVPPRPDPPKRPLNTVVFYVDTLRADVAADPELMPHLSRFFGESWRFTRAYATGTDTLRSLPGILRGNYFLDRTHAGELLRLSSDKGIHSRLVISYAAHDFLSRLLPGFVFASTDMIQDVQKDEKVWGYGAHRPTARQVVDQGIEFLHQTEDQPFFLWLFHFDQHGWREMDEGYISRQAARLGVEKEGGLAFRYRVLAKSVDEQFGRFLKALQDSGHDKDTAVLFLSDHGEGLGQGGFWVHSIFLWENLVRVPLALRVPGEPPQIFEQPVSLVDVAPTLAGLWGGARAVYHGDDLARQLEGKRRRFPILFRGGQFDGLDRIGVLGPEGHEKFVLRLEAVHPELYDLRADPQEKRNLARSHPGKVRSFIRRLAQTPVFPRSTQDFHHIEALEELTAQISALTPGDQPAQPSLR